MELSKEQRVLLNLISISISNEPSKILLYEEDLLGVDFVKVAKESIYQAVTVQAFNAVSNYKKHFSTAIYNKWQEFAVNSISSNLKVLKAQNDLVEVMKENGFPYAIIKGTSASYYYKTPYERSLGDVDFLIDAGNREEIEKLLIEKGYEKDPMAHISHVIFTKPNAHLEMHFEVAGLPDNEHKKRVKEFLEPTVETAKVTDIDGNYFSTPKEIYHGVIILLHTQHHLLGEGLGLRHLCDLAVFVQKTRCEDFWPNDIIPLLKEIGLYKFLQVMVTACVNYLNIDRPSWLIDGYDDLASEVIGDVMQSGNMGKKDKVRANSGMLLAKKGKKKRGAISTLAISLHRAVLIKYPFVKKWWIIYPFIYIYKAVQNVLRMIFGKRTSLNKMIPEAKKRQALYDKLDVYKTKEN